MRLFFLGQLVAPLVVAEAKVIRHRLGLAFFYGATFVEERLDEVFVCGGLGDLFHGVAFRLGGIVVKHHYFYIR